LVVSLQTSGAIQGLPLCTLQVPLAQVSVPSQKRPSLHAVPSEAIGVLHIPVAGSQVPATWQSSMALQTFAVPAVQVPFWQVSLPLQRLPSSQAVPLAFVGLVHIPVDVLQVPAVWH
jgi:hypothetical protein